ncbi:acetyl-CoA acetyltransferase B, mitochondrial [Lucilia sericata]|uniref:acetyl-CoA acetyltransferase B, mitochondrial n=1 Tax=Lucilia sericata TaxID=13632 RepID=UPI0018A84C71|nr:acetyl-CoA acetyltransferase B, mitochondrial [Lucilia sericata]
MQNFKYLSINTYCRALATTLRYFHNKSDAIVIAAAARTPWGKYQGQLAAASGLQLGQLAAEAAVKQSAVPLELVHEIYMNERPPLQLGVGQEFVFSSFLKKTKYTGLSIGEQDEPQVDSLLKAFDSLKSQECAAVVMGGLQSATHQESLINQNQAMSQKEQLFPEVSSEVIENYISKSVMRFLKSQAEGIFEAEIVPLALQQQAGKRRVIREIIQDEIFPENCREDNKTFQYSDGAAALVLTTLAKAQKLDLSPLAVITDFQYKHNTSNILSGGRECVEKLFAKTSLKPQDIKHWEIEDSIPQMVVYLKHHFDLNFDLINPHGGSLILGHSAAASLTRLLTHLTHSLEPSEYGCMVSASSRDSLTLIIQKLPSFSPAENLPLITLFTKDPCPLCDILLEELEFNFAGEYELEKIFIDTKENLRFLRLYRLDIPVVFLNKQFLCMHRLNHRLLRKKLDLFKNNLK